jgi:hypothetical protein
MFDIVRLGVVVIVTVFRRAGATESKIRLSHTSENFIVVAVVVTLTISLCHKLSKIFIGTLMRLVDVLLKPI